MANHQNMTHHKERERGKHYVTKDQKKIKSSVLHHAQEEETMNTLQPTVCPKSPWCPQNMESHAMSSNY